LKKSSEGARASTRRRYYEAEIRRFRQYCEEKGVEKVDEESVYGVLDGFVGWLDLQRIKPKIGFGGVYAHSIWLYGKRGEYGPGKPTMETCTTKIILKQNHEALSPNTEEEKFVLNAEIGTGILATQEGKLFLYNILSDSEKKLFTSRPSQVIL